MEADKQELLEALSVAAGLSFFLAGKDGTLWKEKRQRGEPCITERPGYLASLLEGQQETAAVVTDSEVCRLAYAVLSLEGTGQTEAFGKGTAVFGPCVFGALSPSE